MKSLVMEINIVYNVCIYVCVNVYVSMCIYVYKFSFLVLIVIFGQIMQLIFLCFF